MITLRDFIPTPPPSMRGARTVRPLGKYLREGMPRRAGESNTDLIRRFMGENPTEEYCSNELSALLGLERDQISTYLTKLARRGEIVLIRKTKSEAGGGWPMAYYRWGNSHG